jgi:hypothetical protein
MPTPRNRRQFLSDVGRGVLIASVGSTLAEELALGRASAAEAGPEPAALAFGPMEPLVCLMQETPAERLLPVLVERLASGTDLKQLVAAAALANARTFGGEDYVGFHTLMALTPAYHMAGEMPDAARALPVLKVLYRNTRRIQEVGGRRHEVLAPVKPTAPPENRHRGEALREAVRSKDMGRAEHTFAALAGSGGDACCADEAFNDLLYAVQDETEVHRVVLPYRAWDLLDLVGVEHAHTLLRQSVRYCVKAESWSRRDEPDGPRTVLPKLLEQYRLLDRNPGTRVAEDAWVEEMSRTIFGGSPAQAAEAAAAALAEGVAPDCVGEAISLAANQLVLRDVGRTAQGESAGKPMGSVHGDSVGVHACDSANAWRNMARVSNARNTFACLILGAYQVALDRVNRGGDFLKWAPLPLAAHVERVGKTDAGDLLRELDEAVRGNLQARSSAIVQRYGDLGHPPRGVLDVMLRYATSEDGSLHAEKYYRTASQEFAETRPAFRWRQLVALARVTASEYGRPAAGYAEARELLKLGPAPATAGG